MGDLGIAIAFAVGLSLLIGVIELSYRSNAGLGACRSSAAVLYLLILSIGNAATTLLAAVTTAGFFVSTTTTASTPSQSAPLALPFRWFWYAFLGVFGFEALLQNMNLTFFGKGVLSISDWIGKARDNAVASAVVAQTRENYGRAHPAGGQVKIATCQGTQRPRSERPWRSSAEGTGRRRRRKQSRCHADKSPRSRLRCT